MTNYDDWRREYPDKPKDETIVGVPPALLNDLIEAVIELESSWRWKRISSSERLRDEHQWVERVKNEAIKLREKLK